MNNVNHAINLIAIILIIAGVGYAIVKLSDNNVVAQNQLERDALNAQTNNQVPEFNMPEQTPSSSELKSETIKPGTGAEATNGKTVSVHYTGTLENGTKFDSSLDSGQPFKFKLGAGDVIKGWDKGVLGMKVGEKRKLIIPASLGYGAQAIGSIPANSTLIFEVELLGVE